MTKMIIAFLVLLNPFALYVYLQPVIRELKTRVFMKVFIKASFISFIIFLFFAYSGQFIFTDILQIKFEAFRIFGGVVFFTIAIMYIVHGKNAIIEMREDLNDLANQIALPFMVGAGTISYSILIGHKFLMVRAAPMLLIILFLNSISVFTLLLIRKSLSPRLKVAFDKLMGMSMRLIGFFVGSIGVDMMITGINNLYIN